MTNRVVIGNRGAEIGLWVSKPGYDVLTTDANGMLLDMTYRSEQIIQFGLIGIGGTVGLGLSVAPIVLLFTVNNVVGNTGLVRPYPNIAGSGGTYATISAASFTVGFESGYGTFPFDQYYFVLRRAL